jgi:O-antigen/teichoic acid export membrane protein
MLRKLLGTGALSNRIGKAVGWSTVSFASNNGLRLVSNLILTRLLSPEIFGLMALAQVFMGGITMLSDVGVRASVIRSDRGDDTAFLQTAWSVQIIRNAIVAALCCMIAWPVSYAYGQPILFPLICVLSISSVISGFRSISIARSNRKLMIKGLAILAITTRVATLVVTVFMAWQLQSVWALAIGATAGALIQACLSHLMLPKFEHRFKFEPSALREIFKFGRWILLATLFTFLGARGQQAMFGIIVPVEIIGLIAVATLLANIPSEFFKKLLNTVMFPSFSEIMRERPQDLPRALRKVRLATIGLAFPLLFAVSLLAQPIIDLLYDDRYASAGVMLALLALNGTVPILSTTYQQLLLAEGRSDLHALLMFIWATCTTLGIFLGFPLYGLIGSIVGVGIATSIMFFINAAIATRRGYSMGLLDSVAFGLVVVFYVGTLWLTPIPEAFWSPELVGEIF